MFPGPFPEGPRSGLLSRRILSAGSTRTFYIWMQAAYAAVSGFARGGGLPSGIKPRALWEEMSRSGKSLADAGRNKTTAKMEAKTGRMIQIPRELVVDEDKGD